MYHLGSQDQSLNHITIDLHTAENSGYLDEVLVDYLPLHKRGKEILRLGRNCVDNLLHRLLAFLCEYAWNYKIRDHAISTQAVKQADMKSSTITVRIHQ